MNRGFPAQSNHATKDATPFGQPLNRTKGSRGWELGIVKGKSTSPPNYLTPKEQLPNLRKGLTSEDTSLISWNAWNITTIFLCLAPQVGEQGLNLNRSWYIDHSHTYNTPFYFKSYTKDLSSPIFTSAIKPDNRHFQVIAGPCNYMILDPKA